MAHRQSKAGTPPSAAESERPPPVPRKKRRRRATAAVFYDPARAVEMPLDDSELSLDMCNHVAAAIRHKNASEFLKELVERARQESRDVDGFTFSYWGRKGEAYGRSIDAGCRGAVLKLLKPVPLGQALAEAGGDEESPVSVALTESPLTPALRTIAKFVDVLEPSDDRTRCEEARDQLTDALRLHGRRGLTGARADAPPETVGDVNIDIKDDFNIKLKDTDRVTITVDAETPPVPLPEQLQADLVSRLKGLIPVLPLDPEGKVKAALDLNRDLNQAFWAELRDQLVPLIKPLLQDVPSDYEGKRTRATLVNGLLSTFNLAILIRDDQGGRHLCSVYAVRARESDGKGNLRLLERTASGSSRRSYPIPSQDEFQLIETPHQESDVHRPTTQTGRSG